MSLHESIVTDLQNLVVEADADIITPASLAIALLHRYATAPLEPRIGYASLEHLKQMARKVLSGRFDTESDQSEAHQGELFSGHLQTRYPLPRKTGTEPAYKLREALTPAEVAWNITSLRRSAQARLMHADALAAWQQSRPDAA